MTTSTVSIHQLLFPLINHLFGSHLKCQPLDVILRPPLSLVCILSPRTLTYKLFPKDAGDCICSCLPDCLSGLSLYHDLSTSKAKKFLWDCQGIWPWRPAGFDYKTSGGNRDSSLGGHKQNLACTKTQRKGAVTPQETEPDSVGGSPVGQQGLTTGMRALAATV